jgi:hypothetical protein
MPARQPKRPLDGKGSQRTSASRTPDSASTDPFGSGDSRAHARTVTVRVPLRLHMRGARKLVLTPNGSIAGVPHQRSVDNALLKAIARAYRWRRMLESGAYASTTELAKEETINQSYLCRVLRLTLLAPNIVEAILNGESYPTLELKNLMKPFPIEWAKQMDHVLESAKNIG